MKKILFVIIIPILLSGCGGLTQVREHDPNSSYADERGMVLKYEIETKGSHIHEYKHPGGTEVKSDTKQKSILDGFSIFKAGG